MQAHAITSFNDERITAIKQTVRSCLQHEALSHGDAWEQGGTIPREVYQFLGLNELLGFCHEKEYGGSDLGAIAAVTFAEELSRCTYSGLPEAVLIHTDMSSTHISLRGTAAQKKRYIPDIVKGNSICAVAVTEPNAGSDVAAMQTTAKKTDKGWVLNGTKTYITNALYGDIIIVAALTDQDKNSKPSRSMSLFIVERDTPGLTIEPMDKKHGMLSSDIADLVFNDAIVPLDNLLGEENRGFYGIMENFQNERLVLGGMIVGMARSALELTLDFLKSREIYGKTLWDLQANRHRMAMLAARLEAVASFVYRTAEQYASGNDCVRDISMLKALAGETLQDIVRDCLQLHGGAGYMQNCAIERIGRDARLMTIGGGATEVMLDEAAKRM